MEEEKEIQLEFPPGKSGKEKTEEEQKLKPRRKSTLRLTGSRGDYLPGVLREKVNLKRIGELLRALGRDVTHQPKLEGLEERPEPEKENET